MIVKFKKIDKNATAPFRKHAHDAGYDLTAVRTSYDNNGNIVCHTGIAMEIPYGFVGLIFPRSSSANKSVVMANCVGVIDCNYRGEILAKFKLFSMSNVYKPGERCCQIIILPYPAITFEEADVLSETDRGINGYGSTGE